MLQLGLSVGTEAAPWHLFAKQSNLLPTLPASSGFTGVNPLYPNAQFQKDPGTQPTLTAPGPVYCKNSLSLKCSPVAIGAVAYLNYAPDHLNNISFRPEYYYDPNGWRTGTGVPSYYYSFSLGWQHWLSPQIEFRPEIGYYRSLGVKAFNGGPTNTGTGGATPGPADYTVFAGGDVILHF